MLVFLGIVVAILVISLACVSVKPPPKVYLTCKIFKAHQVYDGSRKRWIAKTIDEGMNPWIVFHSEVKEGQTVEYTAIQEDEDTLTHGLVHAIISRDVP